MTDPFAESPGFFDGWRNAFVFIFMMIVLIYQFIVRDLTHEDIWKRFSPIIRVGIVATMIFLLAATRGEQRAFIYFQF